MTHDEMISVIQAHKEGKRIRFQSKLRPGIFGESRPGESMGWNFEEYNYAAAREPRKCWVKWSEDPNDDIPWAGLSSKETEGWQLVTEQL